MSDVPAKKIPPMMPGSTAGQAPGRAAPTVSRAGGRAGVAASGGALSPTVRLDPGLARFRARTEAWATWGHFVGLLIVLVGAGIIVALPSETWGRVVSSPGRLWQYATGGPAEWPGWLAKAGENARHDVARWTIGGLVVLLGGCLLRGRVFWFVVTSGLYALTAMCVQLFTNAPIGWRSIVVGSLALGYATHTCGHVGAIGLRGILGLLLVAVAGLSTVRGWYDWQWLAERIGRGVPEFFREWGPVCTWAVVLIATGAGVSLPRTKRIHFLHAVLLGALAWHCVQSGAVKIVSFPDLVESRVLTVEDVSLTYVESWRWVIAVLLVLYAAVLLHMAIGMGALQLVFALAWVVVGLQVERTITTMSAARTISDAIVHAAGNPLANMGLPIGPPGAVPRSTLAPNPGPAPVAPSASSGAARPPPASGLARGSTAVPTDADIAAAREDVERMGRQGIVRAATVTVWTYLTALFAGLIAVAGLRQASAEPVYRHAMTCALWFGAGLAFMALWTVWPRGAAQDWISWVSAFQLSRYHLHAVWFTFLAAMALAGTWALRRHSRASTWNGVSVAAVFIGTVLSLAAIGVLIHYGGFPPLPVWTYCAVAAGQSSLMWALLMQRATT